MTARYHNWILAVALLTLPAFASPLQPQWIPDDTEWVVHMDVDHVVQGPEIPRQILLNVDPVTLIDYTSNLVGGVGLSAKDDLQSVTVFGTGTREQHITLVVISLTPQEFLGQWQEGEHYFTFEKEGMTWYRWPQAPGDPANNSNWFGYLQEVGDNQSVLMIHQEMSSLFTQAAHAVKDHAELSEHSDYSGSRFAPQPNSWLYMNLKGGWNPTEVSWVEPVTQALNRQVYDYIVTDDRVALQIDLTASSSQQAGLVREVITGLRSYFQLAAEIDETASKISQIFRHMNVKLNDRTTTVRLDLPLRNLQEIMNWNDHEEKGEEKVDHDS